jgi:hypothetical protein
MKNPDDYFKQFANYKKPINDTSFFTLKIKLLQNDLKKKVLLFFSKNGIKILYMMNNMVILIV